MGRKAWKKRIKDNDLIVEATKDHEYKTEK